MKRNIIFVMAAFAFAILVAGCGGGGGTADIDAMEYGSASELGGVVRDCKTAMRNQDWGAVYDMLAKEQHEKWEKNLTEKTKAIEDADKRIAAVQKKFDDAKDETKKGYYGRALDWLKDMKAKVESIDNARDLYIFSKSAYGEVVVGEQIEGNDGYIIYLDLSTGETRKAKELVKEDDVWKYTGGYWD